MTKLAAVAANFTRDLEQNYAVIESLVTEARDEGVDFLVLPEAAIGGYLSSLGNHGDTVKTTSKSLPPAIRLDGPELARVQQIVGDLLVAIGFCELDDDGETRYNAAAVLDGGQIYGTYRKVHQPLGEGMSYSAGSDYDVFDTPVGRVGLQICYDKAFPEAARIMALEGRADHRQPVGVACRAHGDRGEPAGRPVDLPVQPLRRRQGPGQPGVLDRLQPERDVRIAALRRQRQGRRPGRQHAGHNSARQRHGGGRRRRRRHVPRHARRACSTCATAGPTSTVRSPRPTVRCEWQGLAHA